MDFEEEAQSLGYIAPLNRNTIHQICSGQVILSLAIAVKELIENAIDAAATNIEIHLKNYGSESIKVSDNGVGVKKEHFQALTLKHYTSKLSDFQDLETVSTLGFRGEALSSLCALAELTIITCHKDSDYATKIRYDSAGKIVDEKPAAREIGTTVMLENLFSSLPVRRKEFLKNLKREYSKMCQLLYAYCLVSTNVKFTCFNRDKMGSSNIVIATEGSSSTRDNVISIFGSKQSSTLIEVNLVNPDPEILEEFKVKTSPSDLLTWEFLISNASHGNGRSASDRQFYYINARPFESQKISKLVNDIYRQFNPTQFPFVFLNVKLARTSVDVNVTPDKRQIFIENEKFLLATLKSSLLNVYRDCAHSFATQNNDVGKQGIKRHNNEDRECVKKRFVEIKSATDEEENVDEVAELNISKLLQFANESTKVEEKLKNPENKKEKQSEERSIPTKLTSWVKTIKKVKMTDVKDEEHTEKEEKFTRVAEDLQNVTSCGERVEEDSERKEVTLLGRKTLENKLSESNDEDEVAFTVNDEEEELIAFDDPPAEVKETKRVLATTSIKLIRDALELCKTSCQEEEDRVRFRSQINPANNKSAEQELQRQISKDMFKKMEIIGQFNLGFIITKLENDLFIVDQHASDEKFNFEQLQANTVLERQVLVNPKPLQLTAANEELLMENVEVFQKNGFTFSIDSTAPSTKKVSLTSVPMSRNYLFGKDDIDEMLYMLREDVSHSSCRPSRIRGMFASRACRKSVMVGCPLNHTDMKRLVHHMGEIDQPWNCPHGRPTMRHLVNLKLIKNS